MIFVTVGTQLPFDRLVRAVDEWAGRSGRGDVFAQIGPTQWRPRHVRHAQFLDAAEFRAKVEAAQVVVAHAGMGSILTALELGSRILVMPRRGELMEHRNDHQVATARRFAAQGRVAVAFDEQELMERLDALEGLGGQVRISRQASPQLLAALRSFVELGVLPGVAGVDVGLGTAEVLPIHGRTPAAASGLDRAVKREAVEGKLAPAGHAAAELAVRER